MGVQWEHRARGCIVLGATCSRYLEKKMKNSLVTEVYEAPISSLVCYNILGFQGLASSETWHSDFANVPRLLRDCKF